MSKTIQITSANHFSRVLQASKFVVANFYADWSAPCNQIAPIYDQLASRLTREGIITFAKINHDQHGDIAQAYDVTSTPTFIIFRDSRAVEKVKGADPRKLQDLVKKLASETEGAFHEARQAEGAGSSSTAAATSGPTWQGASIPRGYSDISDQIELKGCEVLNADTDKGSVRALFDSRKPSALQGSTSDIDWVESDTDEQLMLFMPFQSMIKLHTVQITSIPPTDEDDEAPMRPKTLKLYPNRPHNLGFDEADSTPPAQEIVLSEKDWNADGTANVGLRFVKFQNITSLVIFVVDGDGDSEKVRLDRVRLIGEPGVKREMGTLEKIGDS